VQKTLFVIFFCLAFQSLKSQPQPYTKSPAIGIHLAFFDFKGADSLRSFGRSMKPGIAIHYQNSFSRRFDYNITLSGSFLDLENIKGTNATNDNKQLYLEADYSIKAKLFTGFTRFNPYILAGAGFSEYNNRYGVYMPAGLGCQVNFTRDVFLLINSQYRLPVTSTENRHFYHSIGIAGTINRKKIVRVTPPPPLPTAQVIIKQPADTDGDGIIDSLDQCPLVVGVIRYHGCPVPDRDSDGINDEEDQCPDVKGVAEYKGCPIPDRDNDGVPDKEDKCPDEAGSANNDGCPVIKKELIARVNLAAKQIFFQTGSYKILPKSFPALNDIAQVLQDNPALNLFIEGHTDNQGTPVANKVLSEHRTTAVKQYLQQKGISDTRLQSIGYGQEKPIATNETAEGRAMNRRVELKLLTTSSG
jgi:OOP family OmpA-OmpF porin